MSRRPRREEYTVGWICALPVELAAAQEMLDEEHEDLERDDNDENLYSLGSIAGHNVVIVCLPAGRIGNNPAAAVATQTRATFKRIRFGLMVGIGGGVPSAEADIRLGDVVVSQPYQTFGGVVQYDAGKTTPSGFERTGLLNAPPQILLAAVARVRANELRGRSKLSEHLSKISCIPKFQRKRAGPDVLFEAAYNHQGGPTCDKCSTDRQEARQPRDSEEEVVVHYGTIASGNQVMRDGCTRDRLSSELGGILCFEMEAAGLMHNFPCLVIRGICDYADSHKNKAWQAYAAGSAAACAKEMLSVIPRLEGTSTSSTACDGSYGSSTGDITITNANWTSAGNPQLAVPTPVGQGLFASPESLCRAVQERDIQGVQALITSCSDSIEPLLMPVQCSDNPTLINTWKGYWGISGLERRVTALHCAVENASENSLEILRMLLRALPRSAIDPPGYINIVHAMNTCRRAGGQAILAPDDGGGYMQRCTVLTWAALLGNIDAVHILKDAGADINSQANWLRVTPLMVQCFLTASTDQSVAVTFSLLRGGALPNLQDDRGNTALHLALFMRNSDMAMQLLNAGASIDLPNYDGYRAYEFAQTITGLSREVKAVIQAKRLQQTRYFSSLRF
ncbi:purine and uridine phosphorylase [Amniculicola lignicola CBS 123094]|uniref:Purine and uridine phosphorylase n=1 Tax=Amniculicola lignicola CBS 123094 TaxID=1392246 RepID=A0A6A5WQW4_9PLEO|nr:purine and uridine phosphorylase [Amniculicola lignicola CBS 123094]